MIKKQDVLTLPHKYKSKAVKMFSTIFAITSKRCRKMHFCPVRAGIFALLVLGSEGACAQHIVPAQYKIFRETKSGLFDNRRGKWGRSNHADWLLSGNLASPRSSMLTLPRFSAEELPIFCKIEHKIGKKMTMPLKFRLGSVDYVDWLEGKPGHWGY